MRKVTRCSPVFDRRLVARSFWPKHTASSLFLRSIVTHLDMHDYVNVGLSLYVRREHACNMCTATRRIETSSQAKHMHATETTHLDLQGGQFSLVQFFPGLIERRTYEASDS